MSQYESVVVARSPYFSHNSPISTLIFSSLELTLISAQKKNRPSRSSVPAMPIANTSDEHIRTSSRPDRSEKNLVTKIHSETCPDKAPVGSWISH